MVAGVYLPVIVGRIGSSRQKCGASFDTGAATTECIDAQRRPPVFFLGRESGATACYRPSGAASHTGLGDRYLRMYGHAFEDGCRKTTASAFQQQSSGAQPRGRPALFTLENRQ